MGILNQQTQCKGGLSPSSFSILKRPGQSKAATAACGGSPEKGTWLWTLQICIKKTWCPSQWYVPILDGHLSWDSPQMSENPHPALRFLSSGMIVLRVFFLGCDLFAWNTRSHLGPSAFPWISTTHHTTKLGQNQANPETRRLLNC